jgi:hypothetical protein
MTISRFDCAALAPRRVAPRTRHGHGAAMARPWRERGSPPRRADLSPVGKLDPLR